MTTPSHLILLFLAGGFGTLSRYGLNLLAARWIAGDFPYGTWIINSVGCLLFGLAMGLRNENLLSEPQGVVVMVGFLGAFTTFSAFAAEADWLIRQARWLPLVAYVLAQNGVGILCVALGLRLVR